MTETDVNLNSIYFLYMSNFCMQSWIHLSGLHSCGVKLEDTYHIN